MDASRDGSTHVGVCGGGVLAVLSCGRIAEYFLSRGLAAATASNAQPGPKSGHNLGGFMTKQQIAAASIESLNARREALVNRSRRFESLREWHEIASEVEARKGYGAYSQLVNAYTQYVSAYQPTVAASDGQ